MRAKERLYDCAQVEKVERVKLLEGVGVAEVRGPTCGRGRHHHGAWSISRKSRGELAPRIIDLSASSHWAH